VLAVRTPDVQNDWRGAHVCPEQRHAHGVDARGEGVHGSPVVAAAEIADAHRREGVRACSGCAKKGRGEERA